MRNPLQEQLLKAGLVKKSKMAEVVREQNRQRHAKGAAPANTEAVDTKQLHAERVERDRAIAAERNAQARANEQRAQIRQIVDVHKVAPDGDIEYRFTDDGKIRSLLVNAVLRAQLAKGVLVIARHDHSYALLPRAAAQKVYERDATMIVVDHGGSNDAKAEAGDDDAFYQQFKVPDDLIW